MNIEEIALEVIASSKDLTEDFMNRIAEPVEKKTTPVPAKAPAKPKGESDQPISVWEMVKKRAQTLNARVEKWMDAIAQIKGILKQEEERLNKEMGVPKLAQAAAKALEWLKKLQAALTQRQFTLGKIAYTTAAAYKTDPESALKSVEALNTWLDKTAQLIPADKVALWDALKTEAFTQGRDVPESFTQKYSPDPAVRRPKELEDESLKAIPPAKQIELMEPEKGPEPLKSSLRVEADGAWDEFKGWLNSMMSFLTQTFNLVEEDQDALEDLASEGEALAK